MGFKSPAEAQRHTGRDARFAQMVSLLGRAVPGSRWQPGCSQLLAPQQLRGGGLHSALRAVPAVLPPKSCVCFFTGKGCLLTRPLFLLYQLRAAPRRCLRRAEGPRADRRPPAARPAAPLASGARGPLPRPAAARGGPRAPLPAPSLCAPAAAALSRQPSRGRRRRRPGGRQEAGRAAQDGSPRRRAALSAGGQRAATPGPRPAPPRPPRLRASPPSPAPGRPQPQRPRLASPRGRVPPPCRERRRANASPAPPGQPPPVPWL